MSLSRLLRLIATLLFGYLLFQACNEFYLYVPSLGPWLGKLTTKWLIAFIGLATLCILAFSGLSLAIWFPERAKSIQQPLIDLRERLVWMRWPLAIGAAALPTWFFLYNTLGAIFAGPYLRLLFLAATSILIAAILTMDRTTLLQPKAFMIGLVLVSGIFTFGSHFITVTNYPFSLTWSEGNRLYDYSIYFGSNRYLTSGDLTAVRGAHGRNLLWGVLFIIPESPIWLHRLWNVFLSLAPHLGLGYLLARYSKLEKLNKWVFALWTLLFLAQGPIYTPLILSAIILILLVQPNRWLLTLIGVAIAGYYASSSRWTWFPTAATWSAIILLPEFEIKQGANWRKTFSRLLPIAITSIAGLIAGMLASPKLFVPAKLSKSMTFSQPLLWYRLFPNATYGEGILIGLGVAILPLIILLIWLAASRRWPLNWLQGLAYTGACLAFLAIGLTASVKIGGGSNLHNLDMLFVTLILLSALALRKQATLKFDHFPSMIQILLILVVFLPAWNAVKSGSHLQLPSQGEVNRSLEAIKKKVDKAKYRGDILFIDQRQLLTFGYLSDIPLVEEYEKKYLMDKAMASDAEYFREFYQDLANKRFAMIVSEPLYTGVKDTTQKFGEENNAWVTWVADPLLCYYAPVMMLPAVHVQLLVPRANPKQCPIVAP